jgi:hypothetical protein
LLIYLSGDFKPKAKNDLSSPEDSSSQPLVGGETVFYGSRNAVVAEVNSLFILSSVLFFCFLFFCFFLKTLIFPVTYVEYALFVNITRILKVAPTEGMALLHIHGDKCMLHEARNVTKGVKYVFRSDVAFA